ncbi:MAG: hypothetical protein Kow0010_19350 [Dehalococcoidia bacterium]
MKGQFLRGFAAALAVGTVVLASLASSALANGVPQLVKLTYVDGISNWGPRDAEGVLEFSFAEAYARLDVKQLPPEDGVTYEGWLLGPNGMQLYVADVTVDAAGIGGFDAKLPALDSYDYDTFVIAARSEGAGAGELPPQLSIAGRFTVIGDDGTATNPGDTRPSTLPDTGERPPLGRADRVLRTAGVMAAVAVAAVLGFRLLGRRNTT